MSLSDLKDVILASKSNIESLEFHLKLEKNKLKNLKEQFREQKEQLRLSRLLEKSTSPVGIRKKRLDRRPGKVEVTRF